MHHNVEGHGGWKGADREAERGCHAKNTFFPVFSPFVRSALRQVWLESTSHECLAFLQHLLLASITTPPVRRLKIQDSWIKSIQCPQVKRKSRQGAEFHPGFSGSCTFASVRVSLGWLCRVTQKLRGKAAGMLCGNDEVKSAKLLMYAQGTYM